MKDSQPSGTETVKGRPLRRDDSEQKARVERASEACETNNATEHTPSACLENLRKAGYKGESY